MISPNKTIPLTLQDETYSSNYSTVLIFPRVTFRNAEVMPGRHLETYVHLNTVHKTRNTCQGNRQSFVTPGIKTYHAAQYTSHCLYEQLELF